MNIEHPGSMQIILFLIQIKTLSKTLENQRHLSILIERNICVDLKLFFFAMAHLIYTNISWKMFGYHLSKHNEKRKN